MFHLKQVLNLLIRLVSKILPPSLLPRSRHGRRHVGWADKSVPKYLGKTGRRAGWNLHGFCRDSTFRAGERAEGRGFLEGQELMFKVGMTPERSLAKDSLTVQAPSDFKHGLYSQASISTGCLLRLTTSRSRRARAEMCAYNHTGAVCRLAGQG
ncbi:unnamed protein product [Effrenium voratum]|nr:unnamed protein product [Effrenium voratum]